MVFSSCNSVLVWCIASSIYVHLVLQCIKPSKLDFLMCVWMDFKDSRLFNRHSLFFTHTRIQSSTLSRTMHPSTEPTITGRAGTPSRWSDTTEHTYVCMYTISIHCCSSLVPRPPPLSAHYTRAGFVHVRVDAV